MDSSTLTPLQVVVARQFFDLDGSEDYLLAGGSAMVAQQLTTRPTKDLDLFTTQSGQTPPVLARALTDALSARGMTVTIARESTTFVQLVVTADDAQTLVDLCVESPPQRPATMTFVGPAYDPADLAARKLLAVYGRAEDRDFADLYVLAQQRSRDTIFADALQLDPGLHPGYLHDMIAVLDAIPDSEIPLADNQIAAMRAFYSTWRSDLLNLAHEQTSGVPQPRPDGPSSQPPPAITARAAAPAPVSYASDRSPGGPSIGGMSL